MAKARLHGEDTTEHDSAPALQVYGPHAPRVARLLRKRPLLARRLLCAPVRAVHATGAYLHLAPSEDDDEVALRLEEYDPRALLRAVMPAAPPGLYRALGRCGRTVASREFYEMLTRVACRGFAEALLASARPIDHRYLYYLDCLSKADPAIQRLPMRVLSNVSATEALSVLVALLRSHGLNVDHTLGSLPSRSGLASVVRRVIDLAAHLKAPPSSRLLPPAFRQITSIADLRSVGLHLDLCVQRIEHGGGQHWIRLVSGQSLYVALEDPEGLLELRSVGPDLWVIGEVRRARNRILAPSCLNVITERLVAAGWKVVAMDPSDALFALSSRVNDDFASLNRDFDAALDALGHEWA